MLRRGSSLFWEEGGGFFLYVVGRVTNWVLIPCNMNLNQFNFIVFFWILVTFQFLKIHSHSPHPPRKGLGFFIYLLWRGGGTNWVLLPCNTNLSQFYSLFWILVIFQFLKIHRSSPPLGRDGKFGLFLFGNGWWYQLNTHTM